MYSGTICAQVSVWVQAHECLSMCVQVRGQLPGWVFTFPPHLRQGFSLGIFSAALVLCQTLLKLLVSSLFSSSHLALSMLVVGLQKPTMASNFLSEIWGSNWGTQAWAASASFTEPSSQPWSNLLLDLYMYCKHFLQVSSLPVQFLNGIAWREEFNLGKV